MSSHESLAPDAGDLVGQQDLQIADCVLLRIVAARVAVQPRSALGRHADVVTGLVEDGMDRRVEPRVEPAAFAGPASLSPQ